MASPAFLLLRLTVNGAKPEHRNYQLPPLIGVTREGMVSSFGSIAVVATLHAGVETIFRLLLKIANQASTDAPASNHQMILSALTYTGIVLNLGALWSALRMIDILGKMHPLNAQYDADLDISRLSLRSNTQTSTHDVTASYGLRGIWTFMAWHCLISLLFGDLCIVTQVAMLVWLYEGLHSYAISLPKACGLAERTLAPMKPHIANHRHHSETTTTTTTQHDDAADLAVARGTRSSGRGKRKKPTSQERELESIPLGSKRPNRDDGPHEDALEDDNLPPAPAPQQTASSSALSSLPPTPPNLPTPPGPPPKPPFSPAPVAPSASKNDGRGNSPSELYRRADSSKQGGLPHSSGQTHLEYSAVPRGAALTEIQPELDGQLTRLPHASGRGAHSDVYQGLWTGPDGREIKVAVKVLRLPIRASDEEKPEPDRDTNVKREVLIWTWAKHRHVHTFLGFRLGDEPQLISPWCAQGNLNEYISHNANLARGDKLSLIHQAGLGLAYLHQRDPPICHGDIKPENILINDSMEAVLSDFGSSRVMDSLADHTGLTTTDGDHRGTLRYTAPELFNPQILGGDPSVLVTTCKTDVFAFGGVILTTMSGKAPFHRVNHVPTIISMVMKGDTPEPRDYEEIPHDDPLWPVMRQCWSFQPSERPSMEDVIGRVNSEDPQNSSW